VSYKPTPAQRTVIEAADPVLLVTGGAGTGKTTTAAAAVRACLERPPGADPAAPAGGAPGRALFLSFSRAAVAQILDRTADILGPCQGRVQITTYHAFAWRLIERFGSAVGLPGPVLATESEIKLLGPDGTVRYRDLMPLALRLCAVPAIVAHLQSRWSVIVCDEFQDTDDGQYRLLLAIRGPARLLLLGDPNQCIYSNLPDAVGVGPQRVAAARALPGAREIALPEASHRDPSGVLPAAAAAILASYTGREDRISGKRSKLCGGGGDVVAHSRVLPPHGSGTADLGLRSVMITLTRNTTMAIPMRKEPSVASPLSVSHPRLAG